MMEQAKVSTEGSVMQSDSLGQGAADAHSSQTASPTKEPASTPRLAARLHSERLIQRYLWFILGVCINSFGVAFITKAALGTSPISSIPYVLDLALPLTFGETTFAMNLVYIVLQVVLLRRDFKPIQLLQIVVNLLFSALIDVSMGFLTWLEPATLPAQLASLTLGCVILAFGVSVEVAPNVITVPGEGIVRAIASVTKRPFGSVKMLFDTTLVIIACALSFVFFGYLNGLGAGTIISALAVGRLCNLFNRHVPLLARIARLTRGTTGAPEEAL